MADANLSTKWDLAECVLTFSCLLRTLFQPFAAPPFAVAQHAVRLAALLGFGDEGVRRGGVECEPLVVVRDEQMGCVDGPVPPKRHRAGVYERW